jgi:ribonuclease HI
MAKKTKEDKATPSENHEHGIVLYSDGGSREGCAGWGIHGYHYSLEPTTKGAGNLNNVLTENGYIPKKDKQPETKEVKPVSYVDAFGSFSQPASNNVAELVGASSGMFIADRFDIKKFTLFTDSKYVVTGAMEWLPKWKSNNFIKSDGTVVVNKNEWLALDEQMKKLTDKGVEVNVKWIKGHSDQLGNDLADKAATIGVFHSKANVLRSETDITPAQGYWNFKNEKHPFLNNKRVYFSTLPETNIPGQYFMGDHGKDDDFIGKKQVDGNISYVELNQPDTLIELMKEVQIKHSSGQDIITSLRLDRLFNNTIAQDLYKYGDKCIFRPNQARIDLAYIDSQPITRGLVPPKLAMRAVEAVNELKGVLLAWREGKDSNIIETDITMDIFQVDKKDTLKIKDDISSAIDKFSVNVSYGQVNDLKSYKLDLYLGNDLPDRNTLKRIEKLQPKVYVLTWMESNDSFRYAIIIKVQDAIGIWSSICSNIKILNK